MQPGQGEVIDRHWKMCFARCWTVTVTRHGPSIMRVILRWTKKNQQVPLFHMQGSTICWQPSRFFTDASHNEHAWMLQHLPAMGKCDICQHGRVGWCSGYHHEHETMIKDSSPFLIFLFIIPTSPPAVSFWTLISLNCCFGNWAGDLTNIVGFCEESLQSPYTDHRVS